VTLKDGDTLLVSAEQTLEGGIYIRIKVSKYDYTFAYHPENNDYKIINYSGNEDESIIWDNVFPGRYFMVSNRGYVWGTTIPKLKECIFLGAGPDNYPVLIMQNGSDYCLKTNSYFFDTVFTRPHDYYLQMWVNTGLISLLSVLSFFGIYLVDCCKLFFGKKLDDDNKRIGFMCFLGVIGFLGCGIANDSLISTSPVFWCIIGMGIVVNRWIREKALENSSIHQKEINLNK
jgi:hypothetical protein